MRIFRNIVLVFFVFIMAVSCTKEYKPLKVADIFTDNMVLQANKPITIWGTATPKSKVVVKLHNQNKKFDTNELGKWSIKMDAESYGEAGTFLVCSGNDTIEFKNTLFGEVWLCSGQSNMEMPLVSNWAKLNNVKQEVRDANYPEIRFFTVERNIAFQPVDTLSDSEWLVCDSNSVKNFSATAYFFGRKLYQELKVPIGLVHSSWGGTVAEAWTSENGLLQMEDFVEQTQKIAALNASKDSLQRKYEADYIIQQEEVMMADIGYANGVAKFADPDFNDSDWTPIDLPKMWEETSLGNYDGSTWFRKSINLSTQDVASQLTLNYGAPDDYDEVWVNGVKVGENKVWAELRKYDIPSELLVVGKNVITIRVYDYTGGGGFMGEAHQYKITSSTGKTLNIAKGWLAKKGFDFSVIKTIPVSLTDPNQATVLFNGMINPILPLTFQGAIWYQGESNAGRAYQYRQLFTTMINDWRINFGNGDFPFYFVQLANYLPRNSSPVEDTWAELREAQTMALELPNTGMAVTIDIGDALDIHPGNKQDVGLRLALNALVKTYHKQLDYMGPMYKSNKVIGNAIELEFDFNEGLSSSDGKKLSGFAIAGADSVFVWADAVIQGNKIVVSSRKVENPVAVRYAWSSNPECNLVNAAKLPASPFRTDAWKGITEK